MVAILDDSVYYNSNNNIWFVNFLSSLRILCDLEGFVLDSCSFAMLKTKLLLGFSASHNFLSFQLNYWYDGRIGNNINYVDRIPIVWFDFTGGAVPSQFKLYRHRLQRSQRPLMGLRHRQLRPTHDRSQGENLFTYLVISTQLAATVN